MNALLVILFVLICLAVEEGISKSKHSVKHNHLK